VTGNVDEGYEFGLGIRNDGPETVTISYLKDGIEVRLVDQPQGDILAPGERKFFNLDSFAEPGCSPGQFVARTNTGEVVAKTTQPLCWGARTAISEWTTEQ